MIPKGSVFGRLVTTGNIEIRENGIKRKRKYRYLECVCKCGKVKWVNEHSLVYSKTKSCGCLQKESTKIHLKHGMSGSRIYKIWHGMKERCTNSKDYRYRQYGAKGISVCDEWMDDNGFENFYEWSIENGYEENLTIDRIDSKGNYTPENCRWANYVVQNNNTSRNHIIKCNGETHSIGEWSKILNMNYNTLNKRIYSGIPVEIAFINKKFKKGELKKLCEEYVEKQEVENNE